MEHPDYRNNLEQILKFTGGKNLLNVSEVCRFTGIIDHRTVKKRYPFIDNYISAATLARHMCGGAD